MVLIQVHALENLKRKTTWRPRHKWEGNITWGPVAGSCEHGNEPSGSIKGGEFFDQLSDCHHLHTDSSPCS